MSSSLKHTATMAKRHFPNPLSRGPNKMKSFREHWLSDPSCYPLIAIMSSAALFVVGVGASCLMYNPDVRIDPNKRGDPLRHYNY
mmetsp:Transcript_25533/g.59013  ORF Transcript_25533/g.59013 Transcript_25533/m.59013 type:complete len:85 (-) Transcript_25533:177-431(-)